MDRKTPTRARQLFPALAGIGCLLCAGARAEEATNFLSRPGLYQRASIGVPPLSPQYFDPDPGIPLNADFVEEAQIRYQLRRRTNNVPVAPAPPFNPDPGASLRPPVAPPKPFFQYDYVPLPVFSGEPIPSALQLPRAPVWRTELLMREPDLPGPPYGWNPLPNDLALPRTNTIYNLPVPTNWRIQDSPVSSLHHLPTNSIAMTNRYRVPFVPWQRYTSGDIETPYRHEKPFLWHPYYQSVLKGDAPVIGQDIFMNLTVANTTELEFSRLPTPSGVSSARPFSSEFYGRSEQFSVQNNFSFAVDLFSGETAFKPVSWAVRVQPVYNVNYLSVKETTVVSPDPRGYSGRDNSPPTGNPYNVNNPGAVGGLIDGVTPVRNNLANSRHTERTAQFLSLQEAFAEVHISDLSDNYDFVAVRAGNQVFNSDFRGFIFNDVNLGGRLFGNYDNNLWQYNLAGFSMREKDTYSGLNTFNQRDQAVFIANVYRQDAIWRGYTAQASFHANLDTGGTHYDRSGNLVRPEPLGTVVEHEVNAFYLGWAGDGHIGRWNVSHAFYQVLGHDTYNGLAGQPVDINAQMAALEVSYDRDWIRYKASFFYASGDADAEDDKGTGFDTILDNPNFTGGPFSYWVHQGFNLGSTAIGLKQRNSLVPDLRSSKTEGQANFVNPGVFIYSLGAEIDTTPKLRTFLNVNYIQLAQTDPIETALLAPHINAQMGWDFSIGWQYRPVLTDNIILSAGFAALLPGSGYKDIYRRSTSPVPGYNSYNSIGDTDPFYYSAVMALTLTY